MIRTCLFDMGNVLVFFSHERMCQQLAGICGLTAADVQRLLIESGVQWDYERGRLTPQQFHQWFQSATNCDATFEQVMRAGADIFSLNDAIVSVLDGLKERGIRLVLLSNTCQTHFEWVREHYEVLDRFDDCVTSCAVGAIKPEAAIYEAALRAIECSPEECFYTDDIPKYVAAGRQHGLHSELFTDVPSLRKHLIQHGISL